MNAVEIDPDRRRARLQAGAQWQHVIGPAAEHGLAALSGSAPDVGVTGYVLGGGVELAGPPHGLAANRSRPLEVVTADGRKIRADAAVTTRSCSGRCAAAAATLAVVTAMEFELFPVRGALRGRAVLAARAGGRGARGVARVDRDGAGGDDVARPDHADAAAAEQMPELPARPARSPSSRRRGIGDETRAAELLAPLRELGPEHGHVRDHRASGPARPAHGPARAGAGARRREMLGDLDAESLAPSSGGRPGFGSPLLSIEVRHLGGAAGRADPEHGALAALDAPYALFAVGMAANPGDEQAVSQRARSSYSRAGAVDAGPFLNFTERPDDTGRMFDDDAYRRLRESIEGRPGQHHPGQPRDPQANRQERPRRRARLV